MKKVCWGIIGCGDVTEKKSGPAFNKIDKSSLVAVMRRTGRLAKDYADRHKVARWYDQAEDLIKDSEVNAVYIATPPSTHKKYTVMAAEAGLPVYVEKPMARNHKEAQEMIKICNDNEVQLHVAYYRRAMPRFLKIKELLETGAIGEVRAVNIKLAQPLQENEKKEENLPWRVIPEIAGGGKFLDLAAHTLDLFDYYFGPIESAAGFAINQGGYYPAEDNVVMSFRFENYIQGTGSWTFNGYHNLDQNEIIGNKGRIQFSSFSEEAITLENENGLKKIEFSYPEHVQQPLIEKVVQSLLGIGESPSTGKSAARTTKIMDKIIADYYNNKAY
ncbi:oxidoreductase [Halanaerobium saccharolyticum subsp. saccharolyticum DSM 6643]|uniref:Oxidoreductase n=1 Tax=Halanaerobium saccharolyticum subsp. saccharolyticum DSM 6643 TaxID=1293054 RepID=M5EFF7_9FIRM|nr:Gfo/Idh/MocA family oxidoreductase [Halanaerobium saccharolyticum]CCU79912.1 oxidoreductase [Halanaerobium saccharolyticum subsp. saccharolyticum DSM 6643]